MEQHKLGGLEMPQAHVNVATYTTVQRYLVPPWDPDWTHSSDVPLLWTDTGISFQTNKPLSEQNKSIWRKIYKTLHLEIKHKQ